MQAPAHWAALRRLSLRYASLERELGNTKYYVNSTPAGFCASGSKVTTLFWYGGSTPSTTGPVTPLLNPGPYSEPFTKKRTEPPSPPSLPRHDPNPRASTPTLSPSLSVPCASSRSLPFPQRPPYSVSRYHALLEE